jgi:4-coumarate--CoA ligase
MPYKSRWSIPIPDCSLPTFLLTSADHDLGEEPSFLDAQYPDTCFLTRNTFRLWSQRFALGLIRSKHFKDGDRILLFSNNTLFYPVVFMGIVMAGGVFTAANPTFTARELAYQWKDSQATYLLCIDTAIDVGIEAASLAGMEKDRIFVFNTDVYDNENVREKKEWAGRENWSRLLASSKDAQSFQWDDLRKEGECNKTMVLNYSSGTTGLPKGVEVSRSYVWPMHERHQRVI